MGRTARASKGGICYHVLNRGNARLDVFHKPGDFQEFVDLLGEAVDKAPANVFGFCVMTNHFHLVVRPKDDGGLSRFMQWLLTSHVRRYHRHYGGSGHVWQGRFKAFPIQQDEHLLTVLRYVERNPVRAGLVERAENWRWSSAPCWSRPDRPGWLTAGPVERPPNWLDWVNRPATAAEEQSLRQHLTRNRPFGTPRWTKAIASRLGLESTLNPRGRPRIAKEK